VLTNPFFIYVLSFGAVFIVYSFGWSTAYPDISTTLGLFLVGTFGFAALMGRGGSAAISGIRDHTSGNLPEWTIIPTSLAFVADLAANGGLPIVQNAQGTFDRGIFDVGIPHLHPLIVTFGCVFSVIRFADFLSDKKFRYLAEATVPLIYLFLTMYRGPIFGALISWTFVYLKLRPLTARRAIAITVMCFAALAAFGALGQLREGSGGISRLAQPSKTFEALNLPEIVLWPYLYASSPLANLELTLEGDTLNYQLPDDVPTQDVIFSEFLPDVLSKRLMSTSRPATAEVSKGLNVATMYGRSAAYARFLGMFAIFLWFCLILQTYILSIENTSIAVPGLAILNTFVVFSTFQNMIAYSGMSLQLAWLLFILLARRFSESSRPIMTPDS
jgi:hypothetical protein